MCGIAGLYAFGRRHDAADGQSVARMCNRMETRGPDGSGVWTSANGQTVLGHRRLSIIDLTDRAAQPMVSTGGDVTITFNGEIYNYRALRAELEASGHTFRTESDTEVLLQLYLDRGAGMVSALRGMFAFVIWDERSRKLFMARDRFGIKPLYYAHSPTDVRFASEVKGLLAGGSVDISPSAAGHAGFFLWGHVPEPYTLFQGIRSFPAGCTATVQSDGKMIIHEYSSIRAIVNGEPGEPTADSAEELRDALVDSVRHHLISDVPVGIFLSAGRDSTTLLALASETGQTIRTVTLGFEEFRDTPRDETPLAEAVARQYGAEHQTVWVSREDFRDARELLLDRMDQPTIDGVNSYFVSRAARAAGLKVALSGLGADELFGGYPSFREVPRLAGVLRHVPARPVLGRVARIASARIMERLASAKYAGLLEYGGSFEGAYLLRRAMYMPWELPRLLGVELATAGLDELRTKQRLAATIEGLNEPRAKISALESGWYMRNQLLRDTDWASMSHSLEVRVPLVDGPLWHTAARLAASGRPVGKVDMARTPRTSLPDAVLNRPKTGFGVPIRDWLLEDAPEPNGVERGLRSWAQHVYRRFV